MRQWKGRREGAVLTDQTDNNYDSPDASLRRSVKTAIDQHKQSLVRAQNLLGNLSATLKQIDLENQSITFKKS